MASYDDWKSTNPDDEFLDVDPDTDLRISRKVSTVMAIGDRPCRFGECDLGAPCGRHARAAAVAERVERMRGRRVGP